MDVEKLKARVTAHKSGIPALFLTSREYAQLRESLSLAAWQEFSNEPYKRSNIDAREFKLIINGIGILAADHAEQLYGLEFIARHLGD